MLWSGNIVRCVVPVLVWLEINAKLLNFNTPAVYAYFPPNSFLSETAQCCRWLKTENPTHVETVSSVAANVQRTFNSATQPDVGLRQYTLIFRQTSFSKQLYAIL